MSDAKKKPGKSFESDSSLPTDQDEKEGFDVYEVAAVFAQLIVAINPFLDISFTQVALVELMESGYVTPEEAVKCGKRIAREARITIDKDRLGDVH